MSFIRSHRFFDLLILVCLAAMTGWYLWDSYSASSHVFNLILVLPLAIIVLLLCGVAFVREIIHPVPVTKEMESVASVMPVVILFVVYVLSLNWLGFDVGTFLFVFGFLMLHGEKKWHWAIAYALVFSGSVALFFSYMLPYPMPMLIFPSQF